MKYLINIDKKRIEEQGLSVAVFDSVYLFYKYIPCTKLACIYYGLQYPEDAT